MRRYALNIPISTVIIIGILTSSAIFIAVKNHEEQKLWQNFKTISSNVAKDLEKDINTQIHTLQSIATFFGTAEFVDRYDFYTLVSPLYKRSNAFLAIEWVPIVDAIEREKYESFAQFDGFPDFQFNERNTKGERVPAPHRDTYFPVFYLEPYSGNEAALGYNLGSEPLRLAAIKKALTDRSTIATSAITLVQGDHSKPSTLIFTPIEKKLKASSKEPLITGFIIGAVSFNHLLNNLSPERYSSALEFENINITLFEVNKDERRTFISSKNYSKDIKKTYQKNFKTTIRNSQRLTIANKTWEIVSSTDHNNYFFLTSLSSLSAVIISILFFISLTVYLASLFKQKTYAENNLKEKTSSLSFSEKKLQAIVENMADGMITIDQRGIIQTFNCAAEKIFGYSSESVLGNNVSLLMPEPFRSEHDSYLNNYKETGEKKIIGIGREVEGLRSDGVRRSIDLSISEISIDGTPFYIGIIRDITEHKKLERMKKEFISTVSHELRTPLTSIRGALSIIINKSQDDFSDKTIKMLKTAERNSLRLGQLINDILDMEKLDVGMLSFHEIALHANSIAKIAIENNKAYAETHHVTLLLDCHSPDNIMLWGDEGRLLQVLANLLSNAIKFSPKGAQVRIETSHTDTMVRFTVFDQGQGISETFRPYIFERFSQEDSSDTRLRGGTGLGLNISRAIVEKHKGKINFYRTSNHETAFYFEIPIFNPNEPTGNVNEQ